MSQRLGEDLLLEFFYLSVLVLGATSDGFYIRTGPMNADHEEGSEASFDCLAAPSNHIIYQWMYEEEIIKFDYHRYLDSNKRTLKIDHVDRDIDPGSYNCIAQNSTSKFARKSKAAKLDVHWMEPPVEIKIIGQINEKNIGIGQQLHLMCSVNANPRPNKENIFWYFNGNGELPAGVSTKSDGSLIIENISASHSGFFHCSIVHMAGKLDSILPFILNLDGKGLSPRDFSLFEKEGNKVKLVCPWNTIAWYKIPRLGDPLNTPKSDSATNIEIKGSILTISNMESTADAYYICQNMDKTQIKAAVFKVSLAAMYDFKDTHFSPKHSIEQQNSIVIRQGEEGQIRFYLDLTPSNSYVVDRIPNPVPEIVWQVDNAVIPRYSSDKQKKYVYRDRHLIIREATLQDRGTYIIKMKNIAGERIRAFKVEVTFPPEFDLRDDTETLYKHEDEQIILNCGIKKMSEEMTKITWKKDNVEVTSGEYLIENGGRLLRIDKAKTSNSGTYKCSLLTIGYPEISNKPRQLIIKAKLQFIGHQNEFFLEKEKDGRIPCKTKGYGKIYIKWFKITPGEPRHDMTSEIQGDGSLLIRNVQKSDSGIFTCEAFAEETNERINKTIKVEVGEKPKIITLATNKTIQEGTALYLDCQAKGDPKPTISWIAETGNQKQLMTFEISKGEPVRRGVAENGSFIIKNAALADEGKYTCFVINNQKNSDEGTVYVKVLTQDEYGKFKEGTPFNKGMVKTIIIVVSCAIAYLALIIGLTAFCSLRMLRHRRNRSLTAANLEKLGDNRQLMRPLDNSNRNGGCTSNEKNVTKNNKVVSNSSATNSYLPQLPYSTTNYYTQYNPTSVSQTIPGYMSNAMIDPNHNTEFHHLMSAPPPTPLELRSNFSANISSTNSASMYTRSHFSSSTNGGITGLGMSSMERLTYPRHELQTEGLLGKGEFGDVLLARARNIQDGESQSLVVVKSLTQNEPNHCHEFHRQLDMLARTESDYVTKLLGICIEIEPYLLILEYCEWGDLKQFLRVLKDRSNPNMPHLSRPQKVSICSQIAKGMEHLASIRCVHKDLAARNILLTPQLNIKISHLGLCRDIYHSEYYHDGENIFPIRWMPPEAVLKNEFSLQSDVWSFAVTCWEVFSTATLPMMNYKNEEILDLLTSCSTLMHPKIQTMYSSLEQLSSDCPYNLTNIVKKCLLIDSQNRPSFSEISMNLKDIVIEATM